MATKEHAIPALYANLMDEVKVRIDYVDKAVNGHTHMPGPLVREFCYLQLRILCELIALSCLVAHGDIAAKYSKRLGKEWSAERIMGQLTTLHPHFYPQPARQGGLPDPDRVHQLEIIQPSPLTKADLLILYGKCHSQLHRGNVNKLLRSENPIELHTNFPEIIGWAQKINDLLSFHVVAINPDKFMFCMLRNAEDHNRVQAGFAETRPS